CPACAAGARRCRVRPTSAVRLRRTAPAARRSHSCVAVAQRFGLVRNSQRNPTPPPGGGTWTTLGPNSVPWIVQVSHLVAPGIAGYHVLTKTAQAAAFARQPLRRAAADHESAGSVTKQACSSDCRVDSSRCSA